MTHRASGRSWLVGYLTVAGVNLVAAALGADLIRFVALALAMPLLFGWFATRHPDRDRMFWLTTGALAWSWLGDVVGALGLVVKLAAFWLGHLCYCALFWPYGVRGPVRRIILPATYALVVAAALTWIAPRAGELAPAVVAYGVVLGLMAVLAGGFNGWAAIGGALFVISDLSIAVAIWILRGVVPATEVLITSTYLSAQLLLAAGLVRGPRTQDTLDPGR